MTQAILDSSGILSSGVMVAACSLCCTYQAILSGMLLCGFCDQDIHQGIPLHNRELWSINCFQAVPPNVTCGMDEETITTSNMLIDVVLSRL